ncbi:MAG: 2TM domain-containing protein [Chitinophagaceae bacterium]|nr:2TM domain-containing protein [Chitinophagaceae bacterium]
MRGAGVFKWHVMVFLVAGLLMWILWYMGVNLHGTGEESNQKFPWPVWPTLIWLMVLWIHYKAVYAGKNKK